MNHPVAAPRRAGKRLVAGLAACSLLGALALPGSASARDGEDPAARAKSGVALERARAALAPERGAARARGGPSRETTLALRNLAISMPRLAPAERRAAADLLARPTDNPDPNRNSYKVAEAPPFCSAHFCVHYVTSTGDAPSLIDVAPVNGVPDYVEAVSAAAETSYAIENGPLGWPAPKSDGARGGSPATDVYLVDVGSNGIFGYAAPDVGKVQRCGRHCFAYLVLDNDFSPSEFGYPDPAIPLRVTMAHEYNHVLQFGIDAIQDGWLFESTAVWAEEKVFPEDNDYLSYVGRLARTPGTPITQFSGGGGLKVYGLGVFQHWLDSGEGNFGPSVVLGNWLNSERARPKDFAVASTDRSIRQRGGAGFAAEFAEFAAASAEWQTAGGFPDAHAYPDVKRQGSLRRGKRPTRAVLDHTAYRLYNVKRTRRAKLKLKVRAERGVTSGIALVGRDADTATVTRKVKLLRRGGRGSVTLRRPAAFERITAVVVNADGSVSGFSQKTGDWVYTKDNRKYLVSLAR